MLAALVVCGTVAAAGTSIFSEPLPAHYRTQTRLTSALAQPISARWKGLTLRSLLRRLSRDREIAIVLDRRIDPEQEVSLETGERSLSSALDEIARSANVAVTRVGNCLLFAPPSAASRLRTLITLRERELRSFDGGQFGRASRRNLERATITWADLDRPVEIVLAIGHQFGLSIAGTETIPHDMWAGATIPNATAAEALSLVLNQFDLTFQWTNGGSGVRLVTVPSRVVIERRYALHGRPPAEVLRILHAKIDGLDADFHGGRLMVRGTLEQHEVVESVLGIDRLQQGSPTGKRKPVKRSTLPLARQSFELQARGVNLRELVGELKAQGIEIRYDEDALRKAGVDLDHQISVDLPGLPAAAFFRRLFEPHGLRYHFDGETVIIEPK
jgi:hypothetical protein